MPLTPIGDVGSPTLGPRRSNRAALQGDQVLNSNPARSEGYRPIPGPPELVVTGAVVQYRSRHEVALQRALASEIGVALVTEGRCPSACVAVDLGSTAVKELDLSNELVVFSWVDQDTVDHVRQLLSSVGSTTGVGARDAEPYCFALALRALRDVGFSSVSRPSFLQIGFRDVARDLDPGGTTGIRVRMGSGSVARIELDAQGNALVVRSDGFTAPTVLEAALAESFPGADLRRASGADKASPGAGSYEVRLPHSHSLAELKSLIERVRAGIAHLVWKYEPERSKALAEQLDTFGRRDSLARLPVPPLPGPVADGPGVAPASHGSRAVH